MWLDEIAEYIESKAIAGVPTPVYVETIPASVTSAVMVAGPPGAVKVDPELPSFFKSSFQMIVRATKSVTAEQMAQAVSDGIETEMRTNLTKVGIVYVRPRHLPQVFPKSGGDYFEAVVNFDLCFMRLMA